MSQLARLQTLRAIDQAISGSFDLQMTLNVILEQAAAQLHMDAVAVLLLNPHTLTLELPGAAFAHATSNALACTWEKGNPGASRWNGAP